MGQLRNGNSRGPHHHVGGLGSVEGSLRAEGEGAGLARRENSFVIGRFHPARIPCRWGHVAEDPRGRRWLVARAVLDAKEEDAPLGASILPVRAGGGGALASA